MVVVDTSAIVDVLIGRPVAPGLLDRLASAGDLCVPHLLDTEVLSALRRLVRTDRLSEDRANDARTDLIQLSLVRFDHAPLSDRVWELRHTASAFDATFVALAELLAVPLITCDARIADIPGIKIAVEIFTTPN